MFENYPKHREELPKAFQLIYSDYYQQNREGETTATGVSKKVESWLHKKVAADVEADFSKKTLEIGAGTLNQLQYEKTENYEIIEPFKKLFADSKSLNRISNIYNDIDEICIDKKFDRITSVATFEHILDLPKVVAKSCLLLKNKGTLRTSIPNQGSLLWKLGYSLTTGIEFRLKYGLNYSILMNYEHVNTANEIEKVLKYFYEKNSSSYFGIGKHLSLYRFYESSKPRIDLAKEYLDSL